MFSNYSENSVPYCTNNSIAYPAPNQHNPQAEASANYQHWQVSNSNHQGYLFPHINHSNPMSQALQPDFPESVTPQKTWTDRPNIQQSSVEIIYTIERENQTSQIQEWQLSPQEIQQLVDDHFTLSFKTLQSSSNDYIRDLQPADTRARNNT